MVPESDARSNEPVPVSADDPEEPDDVDVDHGPDETAVKVKDTSTDFLCSDVAGRLGDLPAPPRAGAGAQGEIGTDRNDDEDHDRAAATSNQRRSFVRSAFLGRGRHIHGGEGI